MKTIKIISRVLEEVKSNFRETTQFIEDCLEQECLKENISVEKVIFCFQLCGNSGNSKKTKRLNKDGIKKQLLESIVITNAVEIEELNKLPEKVPKPEEAADIIKQYEEILRTKRTLRTLSKFAKKIQASLNK